MGIQTVSKIFFHHGLPSISSVSLSHFSLYIKLRYKLLQTHSCLQYTPIKCNNKISVESTLGNLQLKSIIHPSSGVFLLHKSFHALLCRLYSILLSEISVDFVFLISYGVNCLLYSVKVEQVFEYG